MKRDNRFEICIAGFGGQGVVTIGKILGEAFTLYEGLNSVNTHSYGPESRGGACRSEVVVSRREIYYPNVRNADVLMAFSQVALDAYMPYLKRMGFLLIDPQSVKKVENQEQYRVYKIPAMEIACKVGGIKFQNSVALGGLYFLISNLIKESSVLEAILKNVPKDTTEDNKEAFKRGIKYMKCQREEDNE